MAAGLSQDALARAAGTTRARIGRLERHQLSDLELMEAGRIATCLGFKLVIRLYPDGEPLRDAAQLRLLARFGARVHPSFTWRYESVMPLTGDLRALDAQLLRDRLSIGVDAETHIRDAQEVTRRLTVKGRDAGCDRIILLVSDTHANRRAIRLARHVLASVVPLDTRAVLRALSEGRDPGANGLVVL